MFSNESGELYMKKLIVILLFCMIVGISSHIMASQVTSSQKSIDKTLSKLPDYDKYLDEIGSSSEDILSDSEEILSNSEKIMSNSEEILSNSEEILSGLNLETDSNEDLYNSIINQSIDSIDEAYSDIDIEVSDTDIPMSCGLSESYAY